jgi:hypothetical protein
MRSSTTVIYGVAPEEDAFAEMSAVAGTSQPSKAPCSPNRKAHRDAGPGAQNAHEGRRGTGFVAHRTHSRPYLD